MKDQAQLLRVARLMDIYEHVRAALILARMRVLGERLQGILKDAPQGVFFDVRAAVWNEVVDGERDLFTMPEVTWDTEDEDEYIAPEHERVAEAICERLSDEIADEMVPLHRLSGARLFADLKARLEVLNEGEDPFLLAERLWPQEAGFYREAMALRPHYTEMIESAFFSNEASFDDADSGGVSPKP